MASRSGTQGLQIISMSSAVALQVGALAIEVVEAVALELKAAA